MLNRKLFVMLIFTLLLTLLSTNAYAAQATAPVAPDYVNIGGKMIDRSSLKIVKPNEKVTLTFKPGETSYYAFEKNNQKYIIAVTAKDIKPNKASGALSASSYYSGSQTYDVYSWLGYKNASFTESEWWNSDGVSITTYENPPWHEEWFALWNGLISLAQDAWTSSSDQLNAKTVWYWYVGIPGYPIQYIHNEILLHCKADGYYWADVYQW